MDINSNCALTQDEDNRNYVTDTISFAYLHIEKVKLTDECKV